MRITTRLFATGSVLTLALGACTVDGEGDDPADMEPAEEFPGEQNGDADDAEGRVLPDEGTSDSPPPEDDGEAEAAEAEQEDEVSVAVGSSDLGEHLVDGDGFTLYVSSQDGDGGSSCTGECLARWPIVSTRGQPDVEGEVDEGLVGTVERDDGTPQVTYAGYPLHRYLADEQPGDVEGQGVDGEWSVISPDGELLTGAGTG